MPRVVMKDSTRNRATIQPLTRPMATLTTMGSRKHTTIGRPRTASRAAITPPKEAMLPMDRSNSLTDLTAVAPREIMTSREICRVMLMKFFTVQKDAGRMTQNTKVMAARAIRVP